MALRENLLAELERRRGEDVSGQALAERFGVTRSAVWKAVNALRAEGYAILSTPNRGYRLRAEDDHLSEVGVRAALGSAHNALPVRVYRTLDSTNQEAQRLLAAGEGCPLLILSEEQTAGRGRRGRAFYSPAGDGLYMTLALRPRVALSEAALLTAAAAVAVAQAVEALTGRVCGIKWVNDVCLDGKKLCGILTEANGSFEMDALSSVCVGIGVNVRTRVFPEEFAACACSLYPQTVSRNRLAAEIAARLLAFAEALGERRFLPEYRARSLTTGREVAFVKDGVERRAQAVDIDGNGALLVRYPDGREEALSAGEVRLSAEVSAGSESCGGGDGR